MEVYLIRHGIAAERGTYADDSKRPLTTKGKAKTAKVAKRLANIGLKFDLILTSPLVRADRTASILQHAGLSKKVETYLPLKPDGTIGEFVSWLQQYQLNNPNAKIALVGHQPDLGNWAEMLLWGTIKGQIILKKAGIVGLKIPSIGTPISRSILFLHTAPKWLI